MCHIRAESGLNHYDTGSGLATVKCAQIEYKQIWRGDQGSAIPPAYTSQRCVCCGHTAKEKRLSQSQFRCQICGYTANAGINGAGNILAAGYAVFVCGGVVQVRPPVEAGTRRGEPGCGLNAAGIPALQGGKDVNSPDTEIFFLNVPSTSETGIN